MDNLRNRSLGELFTDLSRDVSVLVRKEIELARLEMSRIANTLARRATFIAIGAVLAVAGLLSLIATLTLAGIALGLSPLASSAIVTGLDDRDRRCARDAGHVGAARGDAGADRDDPDAEGNGRDLPLAGRGRAQRVRSRHMAMPEPTTRQRAGRAGRDGAAAGRDAAHRHPRPAAERGVSPRRRGRARRGHAGPRAVDERRAPAGWSPSAKRWPTTKRTPMGPTGTRPGRTTRIASEPGVLRQL